MAETVTTRMITCAGGLPAFIAAPQTAEKVPVIVLLHERYGLVQHTKDLARMHCTGATPATNSPIRNPSNIWKPPLRRWLTCRRPI